MKQGLLLVAAGVLAVAATGCSSGAEQQPPPEGALVSGTAKVTVNDNDLGEVKSVQCVFAGPITTITTGNDTSGSTTVVSNADGLVAQSVTIRDLGGFTGSYNQGLGGKAEVTMTSNTFTITGTADGFNTDKTSFRTNGSFTIKVAC